MSLSFAVRTPPPNNDKQRIIQIQNVLYILVLYENLLSVKKIQDNGFEINFKNNQCTINNGKKIFAIADCVRNLYKLCTNHRNFVAVNKHGTACIHACHRVLGHRDTEAIRKLTTKEMGKNIKIDNCEIKEMCEICVKAKATRKPFPKYSNNKTKEIPELVLTDVCGPMQTSTVSSTICAHFNRRL